MTHVLTVIWNLWVTYSPWLATALIPALVTGLSSSKATAAEAGWIQKGWDVLKKVMEIFSIVTHKDQPGTFKAPLMLDKLLNKNIVPPAAGALLLISMGVGVHAGCSWFKSESKIVENNLIDCAKAEQAVIQSKDQSLILEVLDIGSQIAEAVSGGADALEQLAIKLAKDYGEPIVACVFDKMRPTTGKLQLSEKDMAVMATIQRRGWHFKGE